MILQSEISHIENITAQQNVSSLYQFIPVGLIVVVMILSIILYGKQIEKDDSNID